MECVSMFEDKKKNEKSKIKSEENQEITV